MTENETVGYNEDYTNSVLENNPALTRNDLKEKLYRLEKELSEVNELKKLAMADYRDQIGNIKDEIKDTLNLIDGIIQNKGDNKI